MDAELEEYTDEQTGMRLTVERDYPDDSGLPRVIAYAPTTRELTDEEVIESIARLMRKAGYNETIVAWVRVKHDPNTG